MTSLHFQKTERLFQILKLEGTLRLTLESAKDALGEYYEPMKNKVVPELQEHMILQYMKEFTETEVDTLLAFYESPVGKKMIDLSDTFGERAQEFIGKAFSKL